LPSAFLRKTIDISPFGFSVNASQSISYLYFFYFFYSYFISSNSMSSLIQRMTSSNPMPRYRSVNT